jgi:hypothetical protein
MKNSKPFSAKVRSCLAASVLLMMFVLLFAACQKDDAVQPSSSITSSSDIRIASPSGFTTFATIKIDHQPTRGTVPDYMVTIYSNATAEFIGRRNVAVLGKTVFSIDAPTMVLLQNLYGGFFNINVKVPAVPDAPVTFTTYNNGRESATLVDYNAGIPEPLIKLREQTENLIHIGKYIDGRP